jgi:hypothetical protein
MEDVFWAVLTAVGIFAGVVVALWLLLYLALFVWWRVVVCEGESDHPVGTRRGRGRDMTVQIQPARPKDQHNGLEAIEQEILDAPRGETVTAIVTYERKKRVEDEDKEETYPVMRVRHIEPILGDARADAELLQLNAYRKRTGENELDLDFGGDDGDAA